jgi:hypothetical protein
MMLFAKDSVYTSVYQQDLADFSTLGALEEFVYIENEGLFVRMMHNDNHLKVTVVVPDERHQMKLMLQGLTCYINLKGKENKDYGVIFPKLAREEMENLFPKPEEGRGEMDPEKERNAEIKMMVYSLCMNNATLKENKEQTVLTRDEARVSYTENGYLTYTLLLPYSSLGNKLGKNGEISIGLASGFEKPEGRGERPPGGRGPGNMERGGGGMRPPGGSGMGMPGGGMPTGQSGGPNDAPTMNNKMGKASDKWLQFNVK